MSTTVDRRGWNKQQVGRFAKDVRARFAPLCGVLTQEILRAFADAEILSVVTSQASDVVRVEAINLLRHDMYEALRLT